MPTKTTKKAPPKKAVAKKTTTSKSKKPAKVSQSFYSKLKSKLGGAGKPLLGLIVVLAVVAIGYFGYVYSSAESKSYTEQRQDCRTSYPNNADKRQKCIDKVNKLQEQEKAQADKADKNKDCSKDNRQQDGNKCGNCLKDFYDKDGVCAEITKDDAAVVKKRCANQYREYVEKGNRCGECKSGYFLNGTACAQVSKTPKAQVQADCQTRYLTYNTEGNSCGTTCLPAATGPTTVEGVVSCAPIESAAVTAQKKICATEGTVYQAATNTCGDCKVKNQSVQDGVCKAVAKADVAAAIAACTKAGRDYVARTNSCAADCKKNFIASGDKCVEIAKQSATELAAICEASNQKYDRNTKSCSDCRFGFVKTTEGKCVAPAKLAAACVAALRAFDATTNTCSTGCANTAVLSDGVCVDGATATVNGDGIVTERLCSALGRRWVVLTDSSAPATCTSECLSGDNSQYTYYDQQGSTNGTAYCKAPEGIFGVNPEIKADECANANRVYIPAIKACGAICVSTATFTDGICEKNDDAEAPQPGSSCNGGVVNPDGTCGDQTPLPHQQPVKDGDGDVKTTVQTNIEKDTCVQILGRAWAKASKKNGTKAGCSVQDCNDKKVDMITVDSRYYCRGYLNMGINEKTCKNVLHRKWIDNFNACAQLPAKTGKDGKKQAVKVNGAIQCSKGFPVYVQYKETKSQAGDECISRADYGYFNNIADQTKKPFKAVSLLTKKAACNLVSGNTTYSNGKCTVVHVSTGTPGSQGAPRTGGDKPAGNQPAGTVRNCGRFPSVTSPAYCSVPAAACSKSPFFRKPAGSTCSQTCITNYHASGTLIDGIYASCVKNTAPADPPYVDYSESHTTPPADPRAQCERNPYNLYSSTTRKCIKLDCLRTRYVADGGCPQHAPAPATPKRFYISTSAYNSKFHTNWAYYQGYWDANHTSKRCRMPNAGIDLTPSSGTVYTQKVYQDFYQTTDACKRQ